VVFADAVDELGRMWRGDPSAWQSSGPAGRKCGMPFSAARDENAGDYRSAASCKSPCWGRAWVVQPLPPGTWRGTRRGGRAAGVPATAALCAWRDPPRRPGPEAGICQQGRAPNRFSNECSFPHISKPIPGAGAAAPRTTMLPGLTMAICRNRDLGQERGSSITFAGTQNELRFSRSG